MKPLAIHILLVFLLAMSAWSAPSSKEIVKDQAGLYPIRVHMSPAQPSVGTAHFVVEVDPAVEGDPGFPAKLASSLRMDMPSMPGMKAVTATLKRERPGRFEGDAEFSMEGEWRIQVILDTPFGEYRFVPRVAVGDEAPTATATPSPIASAAPQASATPRAPQLTCLPNPPAVGDNRLRFDLPPGAKRVMVGIDMPGMAMAVTPRAATLASDGRYEVSVPFSMKGLWHVVVDVDGTVLPPVSLTVRTPPPASPSRSLLLLTVVLVLPAAGWWAVRRRPWAPFVASAALLISTFTAGWIIERRYPPDTSQGMVMDMNAPDMGMGDMTAPLPVVEVQVQRVPFAVRKSYPARVYAAQETILTAPQSGPVLQLLEIGKVTVKGRTVARVGAAEIKASALGVVVRHFVEAGSSVSAGAPVLAWGDVRRARVEARVPVADHDSVNVGASVDVLDGENQTLGNITAVSKVAEGDVLRVEANIRNDSPPMPPMTDAPVKRVKKSPDDIQTTYAVGQDVTLRCVVASYSSVLCVPLQAVRQEAGQASVFVVEQVAGQRIARRRPVGVGQSNETHIIIASGLREGETVVAVSEEGLRDGAVVVPATWGVGAFRELLLPRDDGRH